MYRRNRQAQRRYGYHNVPVAQGDSGSIQNTDTFETLKEMEDIPLPNESESPTEVPSELRNGGLPNLLNFFRTRIHMEEIILIGLIILLLDEGLNGLEDEFLLIMLIYLLIA